MYVCKRCGKDFEPHHPNQRTFCTLECSAKWSNEFYRERRKKLWGPWYRKHRTERRLYTRHRSEDPVICEKRSKKSKEWVEKNREKLAAWYRQRRLIRQVRIKDLVRRWTNLHCVKKPACEMCGSVDSLEFHHNRYIRDCKYAITLCRRCHRSVNGVHNAVKSKKI